VALHVAEAPRWRELTDFSGVDDGEGPGLYRLKVSGGHDSAHWSMTIYDYY
jgi:hypothetical protein